jgi:hypothetical protein
MQSPDYDEIIKEVISPNNDTKVIKTTGTITKEYMSKL